MHEKKDMFFERLDYVESKTGWLYGNSFVLKFRKDIKFAVNQCSWGQARDVALDFYQYYFDFSAKLESAAAAGAMNEYLSYEQNSSYGPRTLKQFTADTLAKIATEVLSDIAFDIGAEFVDPGATRHHRNYNNCRLFGGVTEFSFFNPRCEMPDIATAGYGLKKGDISEHMFYKMFRGI